MSTAIESAAIAVTVEVKEAIVEAEKKIEAVKEEVLESVGDLSGALLALVNTVGAEIKEIPEVAAILRYVPKFVAVVHTLSVPGSEKKTLVLKGLHGLTSLLAEQKTITVAVRDEMDTFIDAVVPISVDTTLDVVKGRVTFASVAQSVAANPNAVAAVVTTSLKCCSGFFCRGAKKQTLDAAAAVVTTTLQTAASVAAVVTKDTLVETVVPEVVEVVATVKEDVKEVVTEVLTEVAEVVDVAVAVKETATEVKEPIMESIAEVDEVVAESDPKIEAV